MKYGLMIVLLASAVSSTVFAEEVTCAQLIEVNGGTVADVVHICEEISGQECYDFMKASGASDDQANTCYVAREQQSSNK
jgi:hypothetical protein